MHLSHLNSPPPPLNPTALHGPGDLAVAQVVAHQGLDLAVHHQHQRRAHSAQHVGPRALEQRGAALLLDDLAEAVRGALVDPLGGRLLGLHLQVSSDRVEQEVSG